MMTDQLLEEFKALPPGSRLLSISQLTAQFGQANLPELEHALHRLLQLGKISVAALPGTPICAVFPERANESGPINEVIFQKEF